MDSLPRRLLPICCTLLLCGPAAARSRPAAARSDRSQATAAAATLAQEQRLATARRSLSKLQADSRRRRFRDAWSAVIREAESAARLSPQGPHAAEALLVAGRAREGLWAVSRKSADGKAAVAAYRKVDEAAPGTATAATALLQAADLAARLKLPMELASVSRRLGARYPGTREAQAAQALSRKTGGATTEPGKRDRAEPLQPARPEGKPVDLDNDDDATAATTSTRTSEIAPAQLTGVFPSRAGDLAAGHGARAAGPQAMGAGQNAMAAGQSAMAVGQNAMAAGQGESRAPAPAAARPPSAKAIARAGRDAPPAPQREPDSDVPADAARGLEELVRSAAAGTASAPLNSAFGAGQSAAATPPVAAVQPTAAAEPASAAASPKATSDEQAPAPDEQEAIHEADAPATPPVHLEARSAQAQPAPAEADEDESLPERAQRARELRTAALAQEVPLAAQLGLKVGRVVIDAGHGGHDTGAIGPHGVREKDVSIAIARRLEKRLRALGLTVVLTRKADEYVSLDDRTRIANEARADLFVSIHCNAAKARKLSGIETWTLNVASNRYAARLAAFENAESAMRVSDLRLILADLARKANASDSRELAQAVQQSVVRTVRTRVGKVRDHGVKQALFYVLLGTHMPSILVETAFVSNPSEEKRLKSAAYQEATAEAIARGVKEFVDGRRKLALAP